MRLRPLPLVLAPDFPRLLSGDGYYHLRRMSWAAVRGLAIPAFDPWTHHPKGMVPHWPTLFDAVGGALAVVLGGGPDHLLATAIAGIALTTLAAAATFTLVFAIAARLANATGGALAVAVLALNAGHHNYTQAGKIDHHALEPLLAWSAVAALLRSAGSPGSGTAAAVAAVLALLGLMTTIPSSALPILLVAGAAGVRLLAEGSGKAAVRRLGFRLAAPFALAGLIGLPLGFASPMGSRGMTVSYDLSPFQPGLAIVLAASIVGAASVPAARTALGVAARLAAGSLVAAGAFAVWPDGRTALGGGATFVQSQGFVALIDESADVVEFGLARTLQLFSPLVLSVPLLLVWAVRRACRGGSPDLLVWAAVLAVTTLLSAAQVRFVMLLAPPLAILAGAATVDLVGGLRARRAPTWQVVGVVGAFSLSLLPGVPTVAVRPPALAAREAAWEAIRWLRSVSPSAGDAWDPGVRPTWSVLAPWPFGHEVVVLGERANVASPFIAPGETQGHAAALAFLLADDGAEAEAVLRAHDVGWVLTVPPGPLALRRWATVLGRDPDALGRLGREGAVSLTDSAYRVAAFHVHDRNASASQELPKAWGFLRLAHVVRGGAVKIFERVEGARLEGQAPVGAEVVARVDLDVAGVATPWFARTAADTEGRFTLRVPFATDEVPAGNVSVVRIVVGGGVPRRELQVPRAAVRTGTPVPVTDRPPLRPSDLER